MDDLIKLCDELENCKNKKFCYNNEIVCTKAMVQRYIDNDRNKMLGLKAQIKLHERSIEEKAVETISLIVTVAALLVATMSLWVSIEADILDSYQKYEQGMLLMGVVELALLIIMVVALIYYRGIGKYSYRNKWKKYIQVVLEDMEK